MKKSMILLQKEFNEYVARTPMTDDEYEALVKWVEAGNSVHENGSMGVYEGGIPMDFLDVYRDEAEIQRTLDSFTGKEREKYLRQLRGEKNLEDLEEKNTELSNKLDVFEYVLRRHGLLGEAEKELAETKERSRRFLEAVMSDADMEKPFEEVAML